MKEKEKKKDQNQTPNSRLKTQYNFKILIEATGAPLSAQE